ncbi:MAG TPA: hypothetical protein DCQ83_06520, partial [Fibrobacteres bacterium]|nr:hypothetical protein [Fibrobacterota bacterium]
MSFEDRKTGTAPASWVSMWTSCVGCLRDKLSEDILKQWILPLKIQEVGESILAIAVPAHLDLDHLSRVYGGLIEHCFHEATGRHLRAQFRRQFDMPVPSNHSPAVPFSSLPSIDLNPGYTFEEFVVGSNSQFAHSAALAVAKEPGGSRLLPPLLYAGVRLVQTQ